MSQQVARVVVVPVAVALVAPVAPDAVKYGPIRIGRPLRRQVKPY